MVWLKVASIDGLMPFPVAAVVQFLLSIFCFAMYLANKFLSPLCKRNLQPIKAANISASIRTQFSRALCHYILTNYYLTSTTNFNKIHTIVIAIYKRLGSCTWKLQCPTLWMPSGYWTSCHGRHLEPLWEIGVNWPWDIKKLNISA